MDNIGRDPGHKGYWNGKKMDKPSVFTDIEEWIGWDELERVVKKPERRRDRALLATLFTTGARASEIIRYKVPQFIEKDRLIRVEQAPLVKNEKLDHRWPYTIPKNEPLTNIVLEWLDESNDWLFPSEMGSKPYLTRGYVWRVARKKAEKYPHWFRSQRAFCLSWYHDFAPEELQAWFTWTDAQTPQHYARPSPEKYSQKFKGV